MIKLDLFSTFDIYKNGLFLEKCSNRGNNKILERHRGNIGKIGKKKAPRALDKRVVCF